MNKPLLVGSTLLKLRYSKNETLDKVSSAVNLTRDSYQRMEKDISHAKFIDMLNIAAYHKITIQELTDLILKDNEGRN